MPTEKNKVIKDRREYQREYKKTHPRTEEQRAVHREYMREYIKTHPQRRDKERAKEYGKQWRANHPGWNSKWAAMNPEYYREYRANHIEQARESDRKYRRTNMDKEREREKCNAWRKAHPERAKEFVKNWEKRNPEKCSQYRRNRRARIARAEGKHSAKDISDLYERQGGKCAYCKAILKKSGKNKFHCDHVVPLSRGGSNDIGNITLACPTCNVRKKDKHPDDWAKENGLLFI
jgi:hypothetical protein